MNSIGVPLSAQRGVSEPARVPAVAAERQMPQGAEIDGPACCTPRDRERQTVDAPWQWLDALRASAETVVLAFLLAVAIGFWLPQRRRRKPRLELEPIPSLRPLPDELPQPDAVPVPQFEPEVVHAKARLAERELELS